VVVEAVEVDAVVDNIIENIQREDLSPHDFARSCAKLRDMGLTLKQCAAKLGRSEQRIGDATNIYLKLVPEVREEWAKGHKAATTIFLRELTGKPAAMQWSLFQARAKLIEADAEDDGSQADGDGAGEVQAAATPASGGTTAVKPATHVRVELAHYKALVKALKKVPKSALAVQAVRVLVGEEQSIPGVFEPAKPAEKADKPAKTDAKQKAAN
jgi:ParB-like chromosome segregation protein Spo0J